jgi:hypothetical protein
VAPLRSARFVRYERTGCALIGQRAAAIGLSP